MKSETMHPPRLIEKFIGRLIDPLVRDQALGDLEEQFRWLARCKGSTRARLWYGLQMAPVLKSFIGNSGYWGRTMFRNYLKSALRNIRIQKGYSFLNITGLALGMACTILIVFYIHHELSYDRFHENADRIFRVTMEGRLSSEYLNVAPTPTPMAPALLSKYPEVVKAARIQKSDNVSVEFADKKFIESGIIYADPGVFEVFTFPWVRGEAKTALTRPYTVVLTERTAKKYFGSEDPIGKFLKFDNRYNFTVTGVIRDIPSNSHLKFDVVFSMETYFARRPGDREGWFSNISGYTYILLDRPAARKSLEAKLPEFMEEKMGKVIKAMKGDLRFRLQPLTSIHLRSKLQWEFGGNGDILYVYIFTAIAVIILAIACINFMNLATARSARRAREVGLRKVVGAGRRDLIGQFLGESISTSLLALMVALVFVKLSLPLFKSISGIALSLGAGQLAWLVPMFFGLVLLVGFAAGSYPAVYLSAFQPVRTLKGGPGGSDAKSGSVRFRRLLVVGQFALSIAMITGTWIIGDQIRYMKNKDIGFQKEQVLGIRVSDANILKELESIKSRLKGIPGVLEVSATSFLPGAGQSTNAVVPEGSSGNATVLFRTVYADADFVRTLGMEIVKGRDLSKDMPTDVKNSVLLNETAARKLGWDNPIGKTIKIATSPFQYKTKTVVGVVKDFHYASLRDEMEPLFVSSEIGLEFLAVKLKSNNLGRLVGEIRNTWAAISPGSLFDFFFVDELFDAQYRSEERLNKIFSSFSLLAVAIACLGLFGLASYMAERRKKEIGIRKVLGASLGEVVALLSKEFLKLVALAALIAWPISYLAMATWLRGFAYRTQIHMWTFPLSGLAALAIAFLTVSYQAVRAASAAPVDSLKYE